MNYSQIGERNIIILLSTTVVIPYYQIRKLNIHSYKQGF